MFSQSRGTNRTAAATTRNEASHCRQLSRTSFSPKGTSATDTGGPGAIGFVATFSILKLEIDEGTAAGGAEAQIKNHTDHHAHPDETGFQCLAEARFIKELVNPDQEHQRDHQGRNIGIPPPGGADASDNQECIAEGFSSKKDPGERNEREDGCLFDEFGDALPVSCGALEFACDQNSQAVQGSPNHKGPCSPVPDA